MFLCCNQPRCLQSCTGSGCGVRYVPQFKTIGSSRLHFCSTINHFFSGMNSAYVLWPTCFVSGSCTRSSSWFKPKRIRERWIFASRTASCSTHAAEGTPKPRILGSATTPTRAYPSAEPMQQSGLRKCSSLASESPTTTCWDSSKLARKAKHP